MMTELYNDPDWLANARDLAKRFKPKDGEEVGMTSNILLATMLDTALDGLQLAHRFGDIVPQTPLDELVADWKNRPHLPNAVPMPYVPTRGQDDAE